MDKKTAMPVPRAGAWWFMRNIPPSIITAALLLIYDGAFAGTCAMAWLVCPIWFFSSLLGTAVKRPNWRLALVRIGFPIVTFGLLWTNGVVQDRIAEANARRVIMACEEFHAAHGKFPAKLEELVPQYLSFVPTAKHCLMGRFSYFSSGTHLLVWSKWLLLRKIYDFETRRWSYLD